MREIKAVRLTQEVLPNPEQTANDMESITTLYCPRCQRAYNKEKGEYYNDLLERVKKHVQGQHPDHDPYWWDTYPDPERNLVIKKR